MHGRLFLITVLVFGWSTVSHAADGWKAGAAKIKVTPPQPMWMAGYASRDKPAEGTETELFAKALVLQDAAGHRAVLVTLDLIGLDRPLSQNICTKLGEKYQLKREQIALNCSHTHCGPVVAENLRPIHYLSLDVTQQKLVRDYATFLEKQIVDVVGQAIAQLADVMVQWGSGKSTFATNRRTNVEANVPDLRGKGFLKGPSDHDVPVLTVRDSTGKLKAIAFGYACHATTLSFFKFCADYPGFAQATVEEKFPDCVALFWAGCGGDQNPLPRRTVDLARHYGQRLAAAVEDIVNSATSPIPPRLTTTYREIAAPLGTLPTKEQIVADSQSSDKYVKARAKGLLEDIDSGKPLSPIYPYPIQTWKLGNEVDWVFLGGEVVIDFALRIKAETRGPRTWVAGYSNDVMAYIPSRRVLLEGGYEGGGAMVYYGLPTTWAPEIEETIIAEVLRQIRQ